VRSQAMELKNQVFHSKKKNEIARKSIIAKKFIRKGDIISESNITTKRPGNGISPMFWDSVIGKIAHKDFDVDDLIEIAE